MGNAATNQRFGDDSDVYVTFDPRTRILDVPDDGRVADLLPGRSHSHQAPPHQLDRFRSA
jgi:hypothetical protein